MTLKNNTIGQLNVNEKQNTIAFKSSDYDLDKDERKVIYKDYDNVLCEKCNQKINSEWYCKKCYKGETEEEKYRMLYGKCNECFKVMKIRYWCSSCNSKRFQRDFDKWTSENKDIDDLIQDNQTSAYSKHILEWIPYDRFTDIEDIDAGGFAKVCSATWRDGRIEGWDQESNNWKRSGTFKVALKVLHHSKNLSEDFLTELKFLKTFPSYYYMYIIECYGITQEPNTSDYALVLKLKDCSLRNYLYPNNSNDDYLITLKDKLDIIGRICLGLNCIHSHNIIHRDLHLGNILCSIKDNKKADISISDFGFCKPANETSNSKIFGVIPYIAPEIWHGKEYTMKSDVYSFGIIINEIISENRPFKDQSHDHPLAIGICQGLRPEIRTGTPKSLEDLIQKCWDENPENRPNTDQIYTMLRDFIYTKNAAGSYNFRKCTEEYERHKDLSYNKIMIRVDSPSNEHSTLHDYNLSNSPVLLNWKLSKSSNIIIERDSCILESDEHSHCSDCAITDLGLDIKIAN